MIIQSLRALDQLFETTFVIVGTILPTGANLDYVSSVIVLPGPGMFEIARNILFSKGRSLQESLFLSQNNLRKIRIVLKTLNPAVVVCDMVRAAPYLPNDSSIIKVCDMDDLLSVRYRRMAAIKNTASLLGTHSSKRIFRAISVLTSPFKTAILRTEKLRMERREVEVANSVDLVMLVSPREAELLRVRSSEGSKIISFPPSNRSWLNIDTQCQNLDLRQDRSNLVRFVFVGDMRTPANASAVLHIVKAVLPALSELPFRYEMSFIGKADPSVIKLIETDRCLKYLGWVPDLKAAYREADIVLCPFITGTGIKLKVLEAMAHGKVVVTNSLGLEGLKAKPGSNIVVADSVSEMVGLIDELYRNTQLRAEIGSNALRFIKAEHDANQIDSNFIESIERLRNHPQRS